MSTPVEIKSDVLAMCSWNDGVTYSEIEKGLSRKKGSVNPNSIRSNIGVLLKKNYISKKEDAYYLNQEFPFEDKLTWEKYANNIIYDIFRKRWRDETIRLNVPEKVAKHLGDYSKKINALSIISRANKNKVIDEIKDVPAKKRESWYKHNVLEFFEEMAEKTIPQKNSSIKEAKSISVKAIKGKSPIQNLSLLNEIKDILEGEKSVSLWLDSRKKNVVVALGNKVLKKIPVSKLA